MTILIVSHVPHYRWGGRLYAYAPYFREIGVWAELFSEVRIAAPLVEGPPPGDCLSLPARNISVLPQPALGGTTIRDKFILALHAPLIAARLAGPMLQADAVHVRCPGNLGLLGAVIAPLFCRRLIAKYAGQWNESPGEPWSNRLQRAILRSPWWRGPVTVYGNWPGQPARVVPFFTSVLTRAQLDRARACAQRPHVPGALRIVYTGRLSRSKNIDTLLHSVGQVRAEGLAIDCRIVGEGPERQALEALASNLDLGGHVDFTGGLEFDRVLDQLESADALVLASQSEGWPKTIVEGMAFGLVCIGSDRGIVPWMLGEQRGLVVPPRDARSLSAAIRDLARRPEAYDDMRRKAAQWAHQFSLEGLKEALRLLLVKHWRLPDDSFSGVAETSSLAVRQQDSLHSAQEGSLG